MVEESNVWELLGEVFDPEVPVLTILDLGIVRSVVVEENKVKIKITPTYTGCPAMQRIEQDIYEKMSENGILGVEVELVLSPTWTTDWLTEEGKQKLQTYGIAPPVDEVDKSVLFAKPLVIPCPKCASTNTTLISQFGSTACKAHYKCKQCLEPFDYFKCLR